MKITSPAFEEGWTIPSSFTCDGENISPALDFSGVPENTKSLALIVEDPDVPMRLRSDGLWVHWVLWNIDPSVRGIDENRVPAGAMVGVGTGEGNRGKYGGPCPPDREHRYFFRLYALDAMFDLPVDTGMDGLKRVMAGHILVEAMLMGRYERKQ